MYNAYTYTYVCIYFLIGTLDDSSRIFGGGGGGRDNSYHKHTLTNTHLPRVKVRHVREIRFARIITPTTHSEHSVHTMVSAVAYVCLSIETIEQLFNRTINNTLSSLPRYQRCLAASGSSDPPSPTHIFAISEALPLVSSVCVFYADPEKGGSGRLCRFVSN